MGYAAVRGGLEAIRAAEALVRAKRREGGAPDLGLIASSLRLAVDRVQGEGGLWDPALAARALRQAEGDLMEAAHLVRSHRSSLDRFGVTVAVHCDTIRPIRRIVPAHRQPPGAQILGRTTDYTGRLIDFEDRADDPVETVEGPLPPPAPRMLDMLRDQGLVADRRLNHDPEPVDITIDPLELPAPRSARLSVLARGETGALVNLWYQGVRGPKAVFHEITLGEVRHGYLPVRVDHPLSGETVELGSVRVTEVEAIEDTNHPQDDRSRFDAGYGLVMGHDERKAIAMAVLDVSIERDRGGELEQQVLATCDGLDASGFLEHLKLPHYVTFRSMVERRSKLQEAAPAAADGEAR